MTDLNAPIPSGSPLYLSSTGDINDKGEIRPAFLAMPTRDEDNGKAASPPGEGNQGPSRTKRSCAGKRAPTGLAANGFWAFRSRAAGPLRSQRLLRMIREPGDAYCEES